VLFYPGTLYLPNDVLAMAPFIMEQNSYLATRKDQILVDANFQGQSKCIFTSIQNRLLGASLSFSELPDDPRLWSLVFRNPYALGHMVNHPPPSSEPNVKFVDLDLHLRAQDSTQTSSIEETQQHVLSIDIPCEFRRFIPNVYFRSSSKEVTLIQTLGLISLRELHDGDELLVDYRFHPNSLQVPEWYRPGHSLLNNHRYQKEEDN
jgi:hypothetical protein